MSDDHYRVKVNDGPWVESTMTHQEAVEAMRRLLESDPEWVERRDRLMAALRRSREPRSRPNG